MARSAEFDIALFRAIIKHRPLGINKHFAMVGIQAMLKEELGKEIETTTIWDTLGELYNLEEMHQLVQLLLSVPTCNIVLICLLGASICRQTLLMKICLIRQGHHRLLHQRARSKLVNSKHSL